MRKSILSQSAVDKRSDVTTAAEDPRHAFDSAILNQDALVEGQMQ